MFASGEDKVLWEIVTGFRGKRAVILWLVYVLVIRIRVFLPLFCCEHRAAWWPSLPATLPSTSLPSKWEMGRKKEPHMKYTHGTAGGLATQWPQIWEGRCSRVAHLQRTRTTWLFPYSLPSFFLVCLPWGTASITTFRPHIRVSVCFLPFTVVRYLSACPTGHDTATPDCSVTPLRLVFVQRWVIVLMPPHHGCKGSCKGTH